MSYQKQISNQQHPPPAASRLTKLWVSLAALAVVAASLAAMSVSQPATAQISPLDPDLCATTYKAHSHHGDRSEADCRTIVAWRNAVVSNSNSVIGSNHHMRSWGTGAQTAFSKWKGLGVYINDGQRVITKIEFSTSGLAGPLPGRLPKMQWMVLDTNRLTGGLPAWIYTANDLKFLDLRHNRLSGTVTGSAFNTPNLVNLLLLQNRFSGPVPNFNFTRLPKLTDLRLSSNNFTGTIPAGWSVLLERGMQRLQVAQNDISGNLPSWVSNLKFANSFTPSYIGVGPSKTDYYIDFRYNKLCLPSSFTLPTYRKLNGQYASVQAYFGNNQCPSGETPAALDPPRAEDVRFQTVDASGNPTSSNPVGLKVTWRRPSDVEGPLAYTVALQLNVPVHSNFRPGTNRHINCLGEDLDIAPVAPNQREQHELTITVRQCSKAGAGFDPTKYTASVSPVTPQAFPNDWSVYIADDAQKTYRDVAYVLGLDEQKSIYHWDAVNQVWQQRSQNQQDFASLDLEPGLALAIEKRAPVEWLPLAGLSTADADTPVQLQHGWNVISAGGDATRGDDEDGAFFIDDGLIDCSSTQGVITILRNIPGTQRFDIELPCHPSRETSIIQSHAYSAIEEIVELDTLFIYFRSVLPVTISWDEDNEKYAPAN